MSTEKSRFEISLEAILWALATVLLFDGLFDASLINGDDAIYADMARTAWKEGNFSGLMWHDVVLHEKPPVLFLTTGLFGSLLGFSDTVMLLPCIVAAFISLHLFRMIVRELGYSRTMQNLSVLLLLSSSTFLFHSRRVMADPLFLLFMLGFIWAWFRLQIFPNSTRRKAFQVFAGTCLGLAILTKWIFAIVPLLAVTGWHVGRFKKPNPKDVVWVGLVALVVSAPWHILQSVHFGSDFWRTYAGYHVLERASQSLVSPEDPTLYLRTLYGENLILLIGLLPAFYFLAVSKGVALRRSAAPMVMLFLVFAPIQFSSTRIEHYILPVLPILVLVGVDAWSRLFDMHRASLVLPCLLAVIVIFLSVRPNLKTTNFSEGSRAACKAAPFEDPIVLVINHYDVAATWHCRHPIKMYTDDERFVKRMDSIDMLHRTKAVQYMEPAALMALISAHPFRPIVTRKGEGQNLLSRLAEPMKRRLETFGDADVLFPVVSSL